MLDEAERCQQKFTDQELEKTIANKKILSPQIITCPHCKNNIDLRKLIKK